MIESNRQKADFIMNNSGIISSKLKYRIDYLPTLNNLAAILLSDYSLEEEFYKSKINDLLSNNESLIYNFENSYSDSIYIIFELCRYINSTIKNDKIKHDILNKLREYPKYFNNKNNKNNRIFISFNINQYNEIKKTLIKKTSIE